MKVLRLVENPPPQTKEEVKEEVVLEEAQEDQSQLSISRVKLIKTSPFLLKHQSSKGV